MDMRMNLGKRAGVILLTVIMAVTMLIPTMGFADEKAGGAADGAAQADPYLSQSIETLVDAGKVVLPESMSKVTVEKNKNGEGYLLNGTVSQLTSGKITLIDELDLNRGAAGRFVIDALSDRGVTVTVNVFLDDEEEPLCSIVLKNQMGKTDWTSAGDRTFDISTKNIAGKHKVSVSFDIEGKKPSGKTTILLRSFEFAELSLPVMYFDIDESKGSIGAMNSSQDHSAECYGTVTIQVPDGFENEYGTVQETTQPLTLEYMRGRGNSTWYADKKPYKVKLKDKKDLFGMGANKHWILLANRYDNSLIRNRLTYWLGSKMGMEYTPQCVPVEVVMNGEYYGSYLLCEQIRVGDSRVAIDDLDDDDAIMATDEPTITGGYLLSMCPDDDEPKDNKIKLDSETEFLIESPSFEDYFNKSQKEYITNYLQDTENAILGDGYKNAKGKNYDEYLDVAAAVDYWWMQEFSANGDAYGSGSTYLYKKRNGKLYWGPLWDFDYVAWGDLDYDCDPPEGFDNTGMAWFYSLRKNADFAAKLIARWKTFKSYLDEATKAGGQIDKYYQQTKISWTYDREKWGSYLDSYYGDDDEVITIQRSYEDEIEQLRNWINGRKTWVNDNVDTLKPVKIKVTFKNGDTVLKTINCIAGDEIHGLPTAPKKKGYVFEGWYNKNYGYLSEGDTVFESVTFKPKYVSEKNAVKAESLYFGEYDAYVSYYGEYEDDEDYNTYNPSYSIYPKNATDKSIIWSSSNNAVAEVNEYGTVKYKKPGTVTITGTMSSGATNSYKLHVVDCTDEESYFNDISEIKLNKSTLELKKGTVRQIRLTVGPAPCWRGDVIWQSLDKKIATVDENGVVTGKGIGTTYIVVFEVDSRLFKKCKVVVTKTMPVSQKIELAKEKRVKTFKATAKKGGKAALKWSKVKGVMGYQIYRATKKNGKYKKVATVKKAKTVKKTIKKLKKGKEYWFKIRPYTRIKGKTYTGKWSDKVSVKAK